MDFLIKLDEKGYCTGYTMSTQNLDGYIKLPNGLLPKLGQKFDTEKLQWVEESAEWKEEAEKMAFIPQEPKQPTNAEVAQMISDLQADLIIAGVI